ncbi:hypothetical protein BC938DRAFT_481473 [Jimgerdemannia flammicorona]|uniref:Uncharacterized protein n=1 Tax=Jimgerdemannia flammicorona TaxID=994334 RepID=A0A433QG13_9FUNG|nr:hypothetical protein BC938DRAFT_481473 [Jimgerdemannia flammicorona]
MRVSEIKENDELQTRASESDVESGSEYNPQYILVNEDMDENEPRFILKLRKVMDTFKESTNPVDKTLAQLGILRLSSRQKIYEPSTMRAEAMRALSEQEKAELKTFTEIPAVVGVPVFEGNTLNDHWRNLSSFTPSTTVERTTLRLHELFLTGLEGNEELTKAMNERTFTAKYIVPLNNWPFQDQKSIMSFWCEKGNEELVRSKDIEHNLWDGALFDTDFESKPHVILHEVSGRTDGCSASKLKSDLLKLAKGMKQHLQKLGRSVNGTNMDDARRIRVGGIQYVGNYAFSQAMCALAPDIYIMWEWGANILPRSLQQMVYLDKTIRSVYVMKVSVHI